MTPGVAVFMHEKSEPPGVLGAFFEERHVPCEYVRLYETGAVPPPGDETHYLFLGGPMSVNDEEALPWLAEEKALIRRAVSRDQPVLGICLGAQLIASAFGAAVTRCVPETGWSRVSCSGTGPFYGFPASFFVFQLHGETFALPAGAVLHCTGSLVTNQAFSLGSAVGLQFHLEPTRAMVRDWTGGDGTPGQADPGRETEDLFSTSARLCRLLGERFLSCRGRWQ